MSLGRAWLLAAAWVGAMGATIALSACYGHNCDGSIVNFGRGADEGSLIDDDTWQSGPIDGDWIDFPHERLYFIDLHELGDRLPVLILPYVSASKNPNAAGDNSTIGAGNIVEISSATKGGLAVRNDTCADYYLRLVVQATPRPPEPPAPAGDLDGGADAGDAGDASDRDQ